jgi:hypothetical protein
LYKKRERNGREDMLAESASHRRGPVGYYFPTVFVTGACVMVIELLGARILAPYYGTSLFVWSSLITVTLVALAVGYWLGGHVADRVPRAQVLYTLIAIAVRPTDLESPGAIVFTDEHNPVDLWDVAGRERWRRDTMEFFPGWVLLG